MDRRFILLSITGITIGVLLFVCLQNDDNIVEIGLEICDVNKNKQSYDLYSEMKSECSITYEENKSFYHSRLKEKNVLGYL